MENLTDDYILADLIAEEHSEILWDMIQSVHRRADEEKGSSESLLKLAHKLQEASLWIDPVISE